jgi:hypothetical protein
MAAAKPIMVRGVDAEVQKKLKTLGMGSINKAASRLLNGVAKNDELMKELLQDNGAEGQLRRFVDLLPVLAWGDHAFQRRKSLEVLDFYSVILSNPSFRAFPGVLQIARHRCGFAALDVALDCELQGLTANQFERFEAADSYLCLALGFLRSYRDNADPKSHAWQTGMAHYNLACAHSQRARIHVYALFCGHKSHSFLGLQGAKSDHEVLWGIDAVQGWRDQRTERLNSKSRRLIDYCGREAIKHLHLMSRIPVDHLASWIAETTNDPDLVFVRSDSEFGPRYSAWLQAQEAAMEATGSEAGRTFLDTVVKRCPDISATFQQERLREQQANE